MYKTIVFLLILVFSFVTSCRSSRQVVQKNDRQSEIVKERVVRYRDTVIYTPASSSNLSVPVSKLPFTIDKPFFAPLHFQKTSGNATARMRVERDTIYLTAQCDSVAIRAQIKSEFQSEINRLKDHVDNTEKRTKGVPGFNAFLYIMLALIIGFVAAYILKTFKII